MAWRRSDLLAQCVKRSWSTLPQVCAKPFSIPVKLLWIFLEAPLIFNGVLGNTQGNLDRYALTLNVREPSYLGLTHWGPVTHISVVKLTIIDSDNGLSPGRRQAIIWTNAGILLIGPLGTNVSEILIGTFSFKKMHLKMASAKWRPFCLGLNVLTRSISWLLMPWLLASISTHDTDYVE